jgi:hypothetical protein
MEVELVVLTMKLLLQLKEAMVIDQENHQKNQNQNQNEDGLEEAEEATPMTTKGRN